MAGKRRAKTYPEKVLKVVNAGEHGAVNIYRGQIWGATLSCPSYRTELREFMAHEQEHRAIFQAELDARSVRRCTSYGLCGLGGLVLGFFTGMLGKRTIAVTTVAVERVVLRHLEDYRERLKDSDRQAYDALSKIVEDEQEHHDATERAAGRPGPFLWVVGAIVSLSTEAVIWTGMKI